jgi:large exoprotein involved in heme utilization and adhesion
MGAGSGSTSSGDIVIRGGRLVVDNAIITASTSGGSIDLSLSQGLEVVNGAQVTTTTAGSAKGGNIVINSPSVTLNGFDGPTDTLISAQTSSGDPHQIGGDIKIHAGTIDVLRGSEISVSSFGAANAGRIDITTDVLRLRGSDLPQNPTQIAANAAPIVGAAAGAGGEIAIHAKLLEIQNGAYVIAATAGDADAGSIAITTSSLNIASGAVTTSTVGHGAGGEIRVKSDNLTLDGEFSSITAVTTGLNGQEPPGEGGVIDIKTGSLRLVNNAGISASTYGDAKGGNININADSITLDYATFPPQSIPGISAASAIFFGQGGVGKGGNITIDTGTLTLDHRMAISTTSSTAGDGGNIKIQARTVSLDTGASIESASTSVGRAGTLSLQASQNIFLSGASTVSTSAPQSSGGNIHITAGGEIRLINSSSITAEAGPGGGGNITLSAPSLIYLLDSTLSAQAVGDGGNLDVDPTFFIMNRGGLISKSSSKNGGNITLLSDFFFQSTSIIDASAPFGVPGTVSVSAPNVDLSGILIGLPSNLLDVETQLRPDCGVRLAGNVSSFIVVGRGGLPIEPGGFVPSDLKFPETGSR